MVSIIIPTYNRREELKELLYSLKQQDFEAGFEIIVVDDGSTDGTQELLEAISKEWDGKFFFLQQKNMGPGAARNLGIKHAQGDILVFVDSDCIAPKGWLKNLTSAFTAPKVGVAGGPELSVPNDSLLLKCFSYVMTSFLTTGGLRGRRGKKLARYYPRSFNMAVKKEAMDAAGGFTNRFYGEDILLSYKVKQADYLLKYVEDAPIYHRRRATLKQYFRQLFRMGRARVEIARLHKSLLEPLYMIPAFALLFVVFLTIGSIFFESVLKITAWIIIIALLFLTAIGMDSLINLKIVKAFFLTPFLFIVQQTAYGLGTIAAVFRVGRRVR